MLKPVLVLLVATSALGGERVGKIHHVFRCATLISLSGAVNDGEASRTPKALEVLRDVLDVALVDTNAEVFFYRRGAAPHFLVVAEVPTEFISPAAERVRQYMRQWRQEEIRLYQNHEYTKIPRTIVGYMKDGRLVTPAEKKATPIALDYSMTVYRNTATRRFINLEENQRLAVVRLLEDAAGRLPNTYDNSRSSLEPVIPDNPSLVVLLVDGKSYQIRQRIEARHSGGFSHRVTKKEVLATFDTFPRQVEPAQEMGSYTLEESDNPLDFLD